MIPTTRISLLERLKSPEAKKTDWEHFFNAYHPVIYRWCRRWNKNVHEAEDFTSELFLVLLAKLPKHRHDPDGMFRNWLKTVVKRTVLNLSRKKVTAPVLELREADHLESLASRTPDTADQEELVEKLLSSERWLRAQVVVQNVKSRSKPRTWKIFEEVVIHERRPQDVAEELGVALNTVYRTVKRINDRLEEATHD